VSTAEELLDSGFPIDRWKISTAPSEVFFDISPSFIPMSSIDFLSDFAAPAASPAAPGGGTPGSLGDSTGGGWHS
jgi:hypothetical protein